LEFFLVWDYDIYVIKNQTPKILFFFFFQSPLRLVVGTFQLQITVIDKSARDAIYKSVYNDKQMLLARGQLDRLKIGSKEILNPRSNLTNSEKTTTSSSTASSSISNSREMLNEKVGVLINVEDSQRM